jgi:hypothetical protein
MNYLRMNEVAIPSQTYSSGNKALSKKLDVADGSILSNNAGCTFPEKVSLCFLILSNKMTLSHIH